METASSSQQQPQQQERAANIKVAMTLDLRSAAALAQYKARHDEIWPEVTSALASVGIRNVSLWCWGTRLFYYAEFQSVDGRETFEAAMARYSRMPRIAEWEREMHAYQRPLAAQEEEAEEEEEEEGGGGGGGIGGGGGGDGGGGGGVGATSSASESSDDGKKTVWWRPMECVFSWTPPLLPPS